ncbi:TPA: hypothetical protein ACM7AE_001990 [Escherichia coli]|uniref:hypothetical protein n=1 Tax=Escherichia coli TaxID=562 RepID=UPI000E2AECDC|nr:hypothetical protein [Escherichia coli]MXE48814.1 hypothetical protein [Escherichia coli]TXQ75745.1 hypothetical protein FV304_07275 [Escherichia coli]SVF69267.1 Uncharacterised protein [Escherichia coli]HAX7357181.1 hypothetical protein [Escherichia coli]HBH5023114.1 hypothetical protein [Escherichia coli]
MTELTKEQLIEEAKLKIAIAKCHPNSGMARVEGELFKIALASLVAEPVAWTDDEELRDVKQYGLGEIFQCPPDKYADSRRVIPLYRVPPASMVQAQGIEIAINELVALSPRLDKQAVETLSMAVEHLRKLVKKQLQTKD